MKSEALCNAQAHPCGWVESADTLDVEEMNVHAQVSAFEICVARSKCACTGGKPGNRRCERLRCHEAIEAIEAA